MNSPTFRPPHTSPANTQQVAPNNFQGRPPNLFSNSQVQTQMGMVNPQASVPFNNGNTHIQLANGGPLSNQQVPPNCQGNPPNMFPNSQNQPQMGMLNPQMQMLFNNTNNHPMNMINAFGMPMLGNSQNGFMMQMNMNQPFNQLFIPNCMNNFPVFQNVGFPVQNMNQFVQRPLTNYNQAGPCNVPVYPNQVTQVWGPQNPNFIPNAQFCMVPNNVAMQPNNQNQPNLVNNAAQLVQGNNTAQPNNQSAPPQQAQNVRPPVYNISQGNNGNDNGTNSPHAKWKNHQNKSFIKNSKRDGSQKGFSKNNNMQNGKGATRSHTKFGGKEYQSQARQVLNFANSLNQTLVQPKKNLSLNYTAEEIQQWREERKKNHPSKAKIEKNQGENMTVSEGNDWKAKLRRQQLKDILEKQAQLGCEIAEIPSHYLYDSETQANEKEEDTIPFGKKEKFQNKKFNKRGRSRQNNRFTKKQKLGENEISNITNQNQQLPLNKREPTLLQKLLSSDIRRDKTRLLQVFKFMVMNSFFKDWPQTPLTFPLVMVKEAGAENEVVEQKPIPQNDVFEDVALEKTSCVNDHDDGDDEEDNNDENDGGNNRSRSVIGGNAAHFGSLECIAEVDDEGEEEEGEIID